jgi:YHS domain-containing protein/uncharacterized membrane protein YraQ (UPF0718 family)
VIATLHALIDVGRGVREGFFMFWETLWALILGFTLSGAVQAFVSKDQMRAKLGDHRPAAVARASGYGMVSSSCSYAASAMAKSLFAKGADFTTSMIFMFASTNLVVELGVVMLVLLGWQFAAAEFVGGPIMIVLLAATGGFVFRGPLLATARARLQGGTHAAHEHMSKDSSASQIPLEDHDEVATTSVDLRSGAAWSDASRYAIADATMLRRELVIGYVVAGQLATLVPTGFWNDLFIHGHGPWTDVENALVGPLIAVISWVCSIGNVPLAAALWAGGISFGGVIAFIFADLIAMPLILIYRKLYGTSLTLRMVGLFYGVMALAGLATQVIFSGMGAVPSRRTFSVSAAHFSWNYTTYLNFAFVIVALGVWWLARNAQRFGGGVGYAIDPVCSMQVRTADAPATSVHAGRTFYFCSDHCRDKFDADPDSYTGSTPSTSPGGHPIADTATARDPVCGMSVDPASAAAHRVYEGVDVWFCATGCAEEFDADPRRYLGTDQSSSDTAPATACDPVCGMSVDPASAAAHRVYEGVDVWFCATGCAEEFDVDPRRYLGNGQSSSEPASVRITLGAKPSAHARGNPSAEGPSDGSARVS